MPFNLEDFIRSIVDELPSPTYKDKDEWVYVKMDKAMCPACRGDGMVKDNDDRNWYTCPPCNSTGYVNTGVDHWERRRAKPNDRLMGKEVILEL